MNRKGDFKIVVGIIALLFVLSLVMIINGDFFKSTATDLGKLKGCGGLLGTLGGQKGACSTTSDCTALIGADGQSVATSGAKAEGGFYYSNIGQGIFGCSEAQFCCIQMPAGKNPPSQSDVAAGLQNQAASQCKLVAGEWAFVLYDENGKQEGCQKITAGASYTKGDKKRFSILYMPLGDTSERCKFSYAYSETSTAYSQLGEYDCTLKQKGTGFQLFDAKYFYKGAEGESFDITRPSGNTVYFRLDRVSSSHPQGTLNFKMVTP